MTKTEKILRSLIKIEKYYNDLNDELYAELEMIRSLLSTPVPTISNDVLAKLLAVKKAADSGQSLVSCQGQGLDGYSELANYRSILDDISY